MSRLVYRAVTFPRIHYSGQNGVKLDLAYVLPNIIVTSLPTSGYLKSVYRTSVHVLRDFLNTNHPNHWHVWNFSAENLSEYSDEDLDNRVSKFPFPDHIPPPFAMIPDVVASIHQYLNEDPSNVAVLHCKAGQGRSGTIFCAYLIVQQSLDWQSALDIFTQKRMRPGWGHGVSILSQIRYLRYTELWTRSLAQKYVLPSGGVQIISVKLRNPKYKDIIVVLRQFNRRANKLTTPVTLSPDAAFLTNKNGPIPDEIIYKPNKVVYLDSPDIGLEFRRFAKITRLMPVMHSRAQVWFNCVFEAGDQPANTGVFSATWTELDGFLGSNLVRGTQAFGQVDVSFLLAN